MKTDSILNVPLLNPGWKKVGYGFLILPVFLVIGAAFLNPQTDSNDAAQVIYGFWAVGFAILNLSKEKVEDEMIKTFRQQAYQTGFYWLIIGLPTLMVINYFRYDRFTSEIFTAYLVLFLLNAYIYGAFQYQKYISSQSED